MLSRPREANSEGSRSKLTSVRLLRKASSMGRLTPEMTRTLRWRRSTDNVACLGAVALGASILERHFTDHMFRKGPDIVCSMDEKVCRELIAGSQKLHSELGGTKGPAKEEQVTMDFAFATVVTIAPIKTGEALTTENLWVKRPGTGSIPAEQYEALLGKKAVRDLPADVHLSETDYQ